MNAPLTTESRQQPSRDLLHRVGHALYVMREVFADWRHTRPFWAGLWTLLGGAIIAYGPSTAMKFFFIANSSMVIGVAVGVVVASCGLMLWFTHNMRIFLGVLTIILSLVSFMTSDFGGLLLGMLLGMIGGSLALAWEPHHVRHGRGHRHSLSRMHRFHMPHFHWHHPHGGARA